MLPPQGQNFHSLNKLTLIFPDRELIFLYPQGKNSFFPLLLNKKIGKILGIQKFEVALKTLKPEEN